MIIKTRQIKGEGRGKDLGFPTINMVIPDDMSLDEGVYAGWLVVDGGKPYQSAIHFGPVPTFDKVENTLEAHLIGMNDDSLPPIFESEIELDIVEKIREVERFYDVEDLVIQITKDVNKARNMLK